MPHTLQSHSLHPRKQKKNFLIWIIISVLCVGAVFFFTTKKKTQYEMVTVIRGDIVEEVSVTGRVKSADSVSLAFEKGGKVKNVSVQVGDRVSPGQALVHLDTAEVDAQLLQAHASVDAQVAKLNELKRGTRVEEVQVKETELKKAEQDLSNAYGSVLDTANDAFSKADDAVRSKTDQIFLNDDTDSPQLTFFVSDAQAQIDTIDLRRLATAELGVWKNQLRIASGTSTVSLDTLLIQSQKHLALIRDFLVRTLDTVDKAIGVSASTIDTYKTNIGIGRANVSTAISNLTTQEQTISTQKVVIERIMNELALINAGSTSEVIAGQEAQVKQAEANVAAIQAQASKMILYAPIGGIITKQDAKQGEIASINTILISIMGNQSLEIEANVPEIDVGRIAIGNPVLIKLDAFPGEIFNGKVKYIDPAENVVDGVVNFKVTIVFDAADKRIRSGLTANLEIESRKKEGVLLLPEFAIVENDKGTFVRVLSSDGITTEDVVVVRGIRGNNGFVEIEQGITEGEQVINIGLKAVVK
ncbi:MAG: efflux RND transporter periplasmic adaptor subunit [Candidatus Paceibacterota bacterium]